MFERWKCESPTIFPNAPADIARLTEELAESRVTERSSRRLSRTTYTSGKESSGHDFELPLGMCCCTWPILDVSPRTTRFAHSPGRGSPARLLFLPPVTCIRAAKTARNPPLVQGCARGILAVSRLGMTVFESDYTVVTSRSTSDPRIPGRAPRTTDRDAAGIAATPASRPMHLFLPAARRPWHRVINWRGEVVRAAPPIRTTAAHSARIRRLRVQQRGRVEMKRFRGIPKST